MKIAACNTLLLILVMFSSVAWSQTESGRSEHDYTRYLLLEGDYQRAEDQFKRLAFFAQTDRERLDALLWTARCERWQGNESAARRYCVHVLNHAGDDEPVRSAAILENAMNAVQNRRSSEGLHIIRKARWTKPDSLSPFIESVAEMQLHHWPQASEILRTRTGPLYSYEELASDLESLSTKGESLRLKSPLLATLMSSVLPGSGQFYAGHPVDGIQALGLVSVFGLMTYTAYLYEDEKHGHPGGLFAVSCSVTGLFHIANLIGANHTAKYRNLRMNEVLYQEAFERLDRFNTDRLLD